MCIYTLIWFLLFPYFSLLTYCQYLRNTYFAGRPTTLVPVLRVILSNFKNFLSSFFFWVTQEYPCFDSNQKPSFYQSLSLEYFLIFFYSLGSTNSCLFHLYMALKLLPPYPVISIHRSVFSFIKSCLLSCRRQQLTMALAFGSPAFPRAMSASDTLSTF